MATIKCKQCGNKVKTYNKSQMYCSASCQHASMRRIHIKSCPQCKREFEASRSSQKFCSSDCAHESQKRRVKKTCIQCGINFEIGLASSNRKDMNHGKFCSRRCQSEHKKTIVGNAHPLKKDYVAITCKWCKKIYYRKPSVAPVSSFCSRQCVGSYTSDTIGRKETSIERTIRELLDECEISYHQEKQIGQWVCDFVVESSKLVIECDGDYWHSIPKVKSRDSFKNKWLNTHGYHVLRLPEHFIKNNLPKCKEIILAKINQPQGQSSTYIAGGKAENLIQGLLF